MEMKMDRLYFLNKLEDILMVDEGSLKEEHVLLEIEDFDSLAFLSIIAMIDEELDLLVDIEELQEAETIKDIINLVKIE